MERYRPQSSRFPVTDNFLMFFATLYGMLLFWMSLLMIAIVILGGYIFFVGPIFLLAVGMILRFGVNIFNEWRASHHLHPFKNLIARAATDPVTVLAEAKNLPDSLEKTVVIGHAQLHLNESTTAETLAYETLLAVENPVPIRSPVGRWVNSQLIDIYWEALFQQGRFKEAAIYLRNRAGLHELPNQLRVMAAWAFYLNGDYTDVVYALGNVAPITNKRTVFKLGVIDLATHDDYNASKRRTRANRETYFSSAHQFLLAFMLYRLQQSDTSAALAEIKAEIATWETVARRNANNVYGERLQTVLNDLHVTITL